MIGDSPVDYLDSAELKAAALRLGESLLQAPLAADGFTRRALELRDELARYQPLEIIDEYFDRELKPRQAQGVATSR